MKVISLLQPWASLVVLGHKKIETRSWNTKYRGELLIHASVGKKYKSIPADDPLYNHYHLLFAKNKMQPIEHLPYGAIIGKVNLIDTESINQFEIPKNNRFIKMELFDDKPTDSFEYELTEQELAFGDYSPNRFGWLLSDPVLFDKPIPAKGQLGIWNWEG